MHSVTNRRPEPKIVHTAKILHLCSAAFFVLCGILVVCVPESRLRFTLVGIGCIVIGGAGIFGYFSNDLYRLAFRWDFGLGIFDILLGCILILRQSAPELLPYAVSVLLLIDGGYKTQISLEGMFFGLKRWWLVMVCAAVELAAGLQLLIWEVSHWEIRSSLGLALIIFGAVNFVTTLFTVYVRSHRNEEQ